MKKIIFCIVLAAAMLLSGCGLRHAQTLPMPEENNRPVVDMPEQEVQPAEGTAVDGSATEESPAEAPAEQAPAGVTLDVYVSDDTAERFVISPQTVATVDENTVFEALKAAGTIPQDTRLISFTRDGNALTIDMSGEFAAYVCTMGTSGEYMLIGSLVNTYLNALGGETLMIYSEGAAMETGHNIYDWPQERYPNNVGTY